MIADERASVDLVVDAGGSGTRAALSRSGKILTRAEGPSCNPATVGTRRALDNLGELLAQLWSRRPATPREIRMAWLALAAGSTPRALARFAASLMSHPTARAILARADCCWLTNDIVPLIVNGEARRPRIAVVCGTGTGFAARGSAHRYARASGREYLLSDEGGGFDIGLRGLRAVVKASDGRGEPTILQRLLPAWGCASPDELDERVYETTEPKRVVASFAPLVLQAAAQGDPASQAIVTGAADELLCGITAVCAATAIPTDTHGELVLAGSLLAAANSALRAAVAGRVVQRFPGLDLLDAGDPLISLAAAASSPTIAPTLLAIRQTFPAQPLITAET
jgi:N-acetylglucosamine kinase-like BadF-type ATPase